MAKLKCFSISGVDLWFYPNDHEPAHFHAKRKGEWEVKVYFLNGPREMLELVWTTKKAQMSRTDRNLLQAMVEKHRFEIFKEWEMKVQPS